MRALLICMLLLLCSGLSAQKYESFTVKAGESVQNVIPFQKRYLYPEFTPGKVNFSKGSISTAKFNYNIITGEMEYLHSKDTMIIANPMDLKLIEITGDTFYFENGYLQLIRSGKTKVCLKQYYQLKDVVKKDSYGNASTGAAIDSYSTLLTAGHSYKLILNQDRIFEKIQKYYIATPDEGFVLFTKKKVLQLYPHNKEVIQDYLKKKKVDFESGDDLMRLTDFLETLTGF
jgi:hypothetical protein